MPALVIEGGANRAAYATGVLATLQREGFVPDAVYGTSAGGALAAWYAAHQVEVATRTWDFVQDSRLMDWRRLLSGRPVFDLRLLYHDYYPNVFGIDLARLRRAPFPVHVTITDADTAETHHPDLRREEDIMLAVHAGAAIPVLSDAPVAWNGLRGLDGGTTQPIPLARAIADGHKDIVCVLNRPAGLRRPEPEWAIRLVARRFPACEDAARRHHALHNEAVRLALDPPHGVRVRVVRPAGDTGLGRTTRDAAKVRAALQRGREDGAAAVASWRTELREPANPR